MNFAEPGLLGNQKTFEVSVCAFDLSSPMSVCLSVCQTDYWKPIERGACAVRQAGRQAQASMSVPPSLPPSPSIHHFRRTQ